MFYVLIFQSKIIQKTIDSFGDFHKNLGKLVI